MPIAAAIGDVSEFDKELGLILMRYAESYAYSRILDAIKTDPALGKTDVSSNK